MEYERIYVDVVKTFSLQSIWCDVSYRYTSPIVHKSNDYTISFDRFNIPLTSVPIAKLDVPGEDGIPPGSHPYTVELEFNGISSGVVDISYQSPPYLSNNSRWVGYVFSYDLMLKWINDALTTAYNQLSALITLPAGATVAPFLTYDPTSFILQLSAQEPYLTSHTTPINIYFNVGMFQYLNGIPLYLHFNTLTETRACHMQIIDTKNNHITIDGKPGYIMNSEYGSQTLINWNAAKGIIITSPTLSTVPESIPLNSNDTGFSSGAAMPPTFQNIIASFDFIYESGVPRPLQAQYILSSPYKRINLTTNVPLNSLDFRIQWYDSNYKLYDLALFPGQSVSLRLLLMKNGIVS